MTDEEFYNAGLYYAEESCCKNCAKLTECFGYDIDWEDPYEELLDHCSEYQEIKNENN